MKKLLLTLVAVFAGIQLFATGVVATAIGTNPTCSGSCDGTATAMAAGGVGPYSFSWTGPSGYTANGANISGLCAGTYIVTALDSSDMSIALYTLPLTNPSPVAVAVTGTTTICAGGSTVLTAVSTGGVGTYSYTWSPAAGLSATNIANPAISLTTSMTYTVTSTDINGCTGTTIVTVTVTPLPIITTSPFAGCGGGCSGSISINVMAGTTYNWIGPGGFVSTTPFITGLCPGTYTVTATFGGCSATNVTTLWSPPPVVAMPGSITPPSCGACDGIGNILATGGTPPYTYQWSGVTMPSGSPMATGLCAGVYNVTVTDGMGCTSTGSSITIPSGTSLIGGISSTPAGCGACNGSAIVTTSGGTGSLTYDWSPGSPAGDGTTSVSGLCVGTYTVSVTDSSGCNYTGSVNIVNTTPIAVTGNVTATTCGSCNGTVTLFEAGGTGPYVYDLNNGSPAQSNGNFTGVCGGTYAASVTDVNGCTGLFTIIVPVTNTGTFTVADNIQPESGTGMNNGFIDLTITGSIGPYTFLWSNGAVTEDLYSLTEGAYTVTVTDSNGDCSMYTYVITTTPTFGYITGYVYADDNLNCTFDAGDQPLGGYYVHATDGINMYYGYTNYLGYYSIYVPVGSYTITPGSVTNLSSGAGCFASYTGTVTNGATLAANDFAYNIPPVYDVCISLYNTGIVPGFNGMYTLSLHNGGNQPLSGAAYVVLPSALTFVSASPVPSSVSGDTIFWNYGPLPTYAVFPYTVVFNTPVGTPLGTVLTAYGNATVTNGTETNFSCNSSVYSRTVTGSFDPNDKTVSPAGIGATGDIPLTEEDFTYLIRFQNTGSGPAVNIYVTDTLSPLLDPLSLQMLDASHLYEIDLLPGNVLRWQFDSIMLADSTTNEAASHGHIQFRISKLNAPVAGEVIENTASIYFDFNEPVITNTAVNTYYITTGVDAIASDKGDVMVYPNPFSDNTTFMIRTDKTNAAYTFEMTDVLGKTVRSLSGISDKQFTVSRNDLQNGIYFYKIYTSEQMIGMGKLIIK